MPPFLQNLVALPAKTKALVAVSGVAILAIAVLMLKLATAPSYALLASGMDPSQTGKVTAPLDTAGDLRLTWLHGEAVADAVAALDFPPGRVHAFVHGEASAVRELRRHLLVDRGLPRDALSISGYWKRSRTEEGWREDKPEWNRLVELDVAALNK